MAFKLPRLTTDVDCEPIDCPGLVVTFWLNVGYEEWNVPWAHIEDATEKEKERKRILEERPWETIFYHGLGRIIERITFPPSMTDGETAEVIDIPDGEALYNLMTTHDFDQALILWAQSIYQDQRAARMKVEAKN